MENKVYFEIWIPLKTKDSYIYSCSTNTYFTYKGETKVSYIWFFFLNIKCLFGYLKNHTSVHIKQTQILHKKITQHQSQETYLHLLHLANILVILDNMEMVYLIIQSFFFLNDYSVILIKVMISLFHVRFLKTVLYKFLKNWYNLCILYVIVCYVIYISLLNLNLNWNV